MITDCKASTWLWASSERIINQKNSAVVEEAVNRFVGSCRLLNILGIFWHKPLLVSCPPTCTSRNLRLKISVSASCNWKHREFSDDNESRIINNFSRQGGTNTECVNWQERIRSLLVSLTPHGEKGNQTRFQPRETDLVILQITLLFSLLACRASQGTKIGRK